MTTATAPRKTRISKEERSRQLEALSARVKEAIDAMGADELADLGLLFEGRYSARNVALIIDQCPTATVVRGYDQWLAEGRQVRRGETGLKIRKVLGPKDGDADARKGLIWLTVFDIGQTDPTA